MLKVNCLLCLPSSSSNCLCCFNNFDEEHHFGNCFDHGNCSVVGIHQYAVTQQNGSGVGVGDHLGAYRLFDYRCSSIHCASTI